MKGMNEILDYETELAQRPSLDAYLGSTKRTALTNSANNKDKQLQDWANFCDYKCHCQVLVSFLKAKLFFS